MAFTCLPKEKADAFKKALASKDIQISDLLNKSGDELVSTFEPFAGKDAKAMATLFEEKLILKNKVQGIKNFIQKMTETGRYSPEKIAELKQAASDYKQAQQERIFSPEENQTFLSNLAERAAGTAVTRVEAAKIGELTKAINDALAKPTDNFSGISADYLNASEALRKYVASLKPTTAVASIGKNLGEIGRNSLLMNPSTPVKTTISQIMNNIVDVFTRRIAAGKVKGQVSDLASQAKQEAWDTFKKTKLNVSSMEKIDDTGKLGEGTRFEANVGVTKSSKPVKAVEAVVRRAAQLTNKISIDLEHNYSFVRAYQYAFHDAANILATKIGQGDRAAAETVFRDAVRVEPQTDIGLIIRKEAQMQAARVTNTNPTILSNMSLAVKDALNGNTRFFGGKLGISGLGDALIPIAKIPADVIANGIENAGLGIPLGAADMVKGMRAMGRAGEDIIAKQQGFAQFSQGFQKVARTVGTLSLAAYFANSLTKQDFLTDRYGTNFVKIAGVWVNTEYISFLSPALSGMMTVKKDQLYNQNAGDIVGQYLAGATQGLKNLPAIGDINQAVSSITNPTFSKGLWKYGKDFINSRGVPSFIRQLGGDQPIKGLFFSTSGLPTNAELNKLGAK
jgi:hypothetical protein